MVVGERFLCFAISCVDRFLSVNIWWDWSWVSLRVEITWERFTNFTYICTYIHGDCSLILYTRTVTSSSLVLLGCLLWSIGISIAIVFLEQNSTILLRKGRPWCFSHTTVTPSIFWRASVLEGLHKDKNNHNSLPFVCRHGYVFWNELYVFRNCLHRYAHK